MAMTPDELRRPRSRAVSIAPLIARVAAVLDQCGARIEQLLDGSDRPSLILEVESRLEALPGQARELRRRLIHGA